MLLRGPNADIQHEIVGVVNDVRVGAALQRGLCSLAQLPDPDSAAAAREQAARALELAGDALAVEQDYARLRAINETFRAR